MSYGRIQVQQTIDSTFHVHIASSTSTHASNTFSLDQVYRTNGLTFDLSEDIFKLNTNRSTRRGGTGRDAKQITTLLAKKSSLKNSIFEEGVKLWNDIPLDIRSETNLKVFIQKVKNHI